jgi:hypothetical protein
MQLIPMHWHEICLPLLIKGDSMKLYQVEYQAVITVEADDLETAEIGATAFVKENPHVIRVRGAHELNRAPQRGKFRPIHFAL